MLRQLIPGMQLLSLFLRHNTVKVENGGPYVQFICADFPAFRTERKSTAPVSEPVSHCPFCLLFTKKGDRYQFQRYNDRNTVATTCNGRDWPSICNRREFVKFYLRNVLHIDFSITGMRNAGFWKSVRDAFRFNGIACNPAMKSRVMLDIMGMSEELLLQADQKIESYMRYLNSHDQYAVVLYSNGVFSGTRWQRPQHRQIVPRR